MSCSKLARSLLSRSKSRAPPIPTYNATHIYKRFESSTTVDQHINDKKHAQQNPTRIDRQAQEYALTGTDDAVASQSKLSFDRSQSTDPQQAVKTAGESSKEYNPLEVSAANPDVSLKGTGVEFSAPAYTPQAPSYDSQSRATTKTKTHAPDRKSRAFAGSDSRKAQSPGEVAKSHVYIGR